MNHFVRGPKGVCVPNLESGAGQFHSRASSWFSALGRLAALLAMSGLASTAVGAGDGTDPRALSDPAMESLPPPLAANTSTSQSVALSYLEGLRPTSMSSVATLGPDLFGDKVNLFNGSLQFEHTDLELPGNSALAVALTRRYSPGRMPYVRGIFGDWDLHVPRIAGSFSEHGWVTSTGGTNRCSGYSTPKTVVLTSGVTSVQFTPEQFWHGTTLDVPGQGADELLWRASSYPAQPGGGQAYPLVTKGHWQIRCLGSLQNAAGEGFLAISPQGVQYHFNWMASRYAGGVRKGNASLGKYDMSLYATQVIDRFGNQVNYSFDPAQPNRLLKISSGDGREITLSYVGDLVASATDGTRTYRYAYDSEGRLSTVTRPDNSQWQFNLGGMLYPQHDWLGEGAKCDSPGVFPSNASMVGVITHPSGAVGTFTTQFRTHGRTYVDKHCWFVQGTSGQTTGAVYPHYSRSQTLTEKLITGPGLAPMKWAYSYGVVAGWNPCVGCPDRKTNTVTAPDGSVSRHVFGVRWRVNEGQLLQTEEGVSGSESLRRTTIRYRTPYQESCPERVGSSPNLHGDVLSSMNRPEDERVVFQQGVHLTWRAAAAGEGLDNWCRPIKVTESSTLSPPRTRTLRTSYHDSTWPWVVGQLRQRIDHDGSVALQLDYHALTALPERRWEYDRLVQRYAYHGDGTLWKVFDPLGRPTTWSNYHRGVARHFVHRDGAQESAEINNLGKPLWYTNAAGTTTQFGYDAMGRLNLIRPPAEAHGPYYDLTDRFEQVGTAEHGLGPWHWRQTSRTGNAVTVRYYDALWRARLVHSFDAADEANTASRTVIEYDHDGRKTYESLPTRAIHAVGDSPPGRRFFFDALGREVRQEQSSEIGLLTTKTKYIEDLKKEAINARGATTIFHYQAFAKPDDLAITYIDLPEDAWVQIDRDTENRALAITRGGSHGGATQDLTRRYTYDAHKRLCKTVEPETGATVLAYDAAGNVSGRASGLAPSGAGCNWDLVPGNKRINLQYDARDQLTRTVHGDGSSVIEQAHTPDGQLAQITASRAGANTIRWTYGYNNRRMLELEQYHWGDPAGSWSFRRVIDAHGNLYALQDPHGQIDYRPNALGQPTQVGTYVSNVQFHPNGMVAGYTAANGRNHSVSLNERGLPRDWVHSGAVHERISYDPVGNITEIADLLQGQHRSMPWYDGLDRLRQANGPWGSGSYTYDAIDNLVASTVGGRSVTHLIDPSTNRLTGLSGSVSLAVSYDDQGNVRSRGAQTFQFDLANRLVSTPGKASYVYDGHGRRSLTWFADGSVRYGAYTQDGKLRLTWQTGQGSKRYAYLGDRLVAEHDSAGVMSHVHADHLGSPVVRSNAAGVVMESTRTRYEPYGATVAGSFNPTGIGFTGHVNDPEIGMVYMQQRYYDPIAGRFLSVDPVAVNMQTGQMFNRYEYAYGNPYRYFDPDGRCNASRIDVAAGSICGGSGGRLAAAAESIAAHQKHLARELTSAARDAGSALAAAVPKALSLLRYTPIGLAATGLFSEGADSEGSNIRDNRSKGQKAEDEVAAVLEGAGRDVDRQVRKDTPFGPRVIDIEVKDKDGNVLGGVEVKSGKSRYRQDQRSKDEWLRQNGYPVDVVRKP